jgi:cation diffusion facilitator family transporter
VALNGALAQQYMYRLITFTVTRTNKFFNSRFTSLYNQVLLLCCQPGSLIRNILRCHKQSPGLALKKHIMSDSYLQQHVHPNTLTNSNSLRAYETQKITLVGMVLDILLGVAKIAVGMIAHSHALIADGIHSFTDAATDVMVIAITWVAHQDPDEDHPYGHGKFETLGTVLLGSTLIAVAGAMAYDSIYRFFSADIDIIPEWPALLVVSLSIIGKEWVYRYTLRAGKRLNSDLLIANAWHSRSDALSSVVVLIALLGVMAGFLWLDALATVVIALLIARIGWSLAWNSLKELVETSVPREIIDEMRNLIFAVEGVQDSHFLRGRFVGPSILLDVHIQVAPTISVSEGHQIGNAVMLRLSEHNKSVSDITLHIDAEEDLIIAKQIASVKTLPNRTQIQQELTNRWQSFIPAEKIINIQIHYLKEKIQLEVMLALRIDDINEKLIIDLNNAVNDLPWLSSVKFWNALPAVPTNSPNPQK